MKKLVLTGLIVAALCSGCSKQVPAGMYKFKLGDKIDVEGGRVHFKLNKSGDSLFVYIQMPWTGDPEKDVQYDVGIYGKDQQLIQAIVHKSKRKYSNISHNFTLVDKSNVNRVAYFSIKVSESGD